MSNSTIWEACRLYGAHLLPTHNNPALFSAWLDRYQSMETQLLTDTTGDKVEGKNKYTDGNQVWGPIRWPWKANTATPEWNDYPRTFLFNEHLLGIGASGWDWVAKETRWLGYDFDELTGHAEGIGVTDEDLEKVVKAAPDFVDVVRSTRGSGKHLYIFFDEPFPKTETHNEHAALARAFLPVMSAAAGFDFSAKMDVCGRILWIWHKDATTENRGFAPLQLATRHLTASDVPPTWRDHLDVVSGSRTRVKVRGWTPDGQTSGEELDEDTLSYVNTPLDDVHKRILKDLESSGYTFNWVDDHWLAQSHTQALKKVHTEWAEAGHPMRGPFDTTSPDSDPGKVNCLVGNTKVITREGLKPISDLAGRTVEIITSRGVWVKAPFKSYGEQEVFAVTLERRGKTRVIKATADHRWFVCTYMAKDAGTKVSFGNREEVTTNELEEGRILIQTKPQLKVVPSIIGIQHGLVWGDGTNGGSRITSHLSLYGEKASALSKFFAEHPKREINRSVGGIRITNLPYHFKSLVPFAL